MLPQGPALARPCPAMRTALPCRLHGSAIAGPCHCMALSQGLAIAWPCTTNPKPYLLHCSSRLALHHQP
jgi:hypothetical protein